MRDITLCHPRLQVLAEQLIEACAAQGLAIKIGADVYKRQLPGLAGIYEQLSQ